MDYDHDEAAEPQEQGINDVHGLPDPNGPVQPMTDQSPPSPSWRRRLVGLGLGGLGVGFVVMAFAPATCTGATRASRLKWQEKQDLINQAINEQDVDGQCDELPSEPQ